MYSVTIIVVTYYVNQWYLILCPLWACNLENKNILFHYVHTQKYNMNSGEVRVRLMHKNHEVSAVQRS